jgi:hypothetical protein
MRERVEAARRCFALGEWPSEDRRIWETARDPKRWGRVVRRSPAAGLDPTAIEKYEEGYGRYLGYLAYRGLLAPDEKPQHRVTETRLADFIDLMLDNGNSGHTIYGRVSELVGALRILDPHGDHGWILRPGGVALRGRLDMTPRHLTVHHPRTLFRWGIRLMEAALTLAGPRRRQVMLRDGLMIALFAARAMRLRSQAALCLESSVRKVDGRWWVILSASDVKTGRPIEYPAPISLQPWIERYLATERAELLAGKESDAFWIGWDGKPLGRRGIEKRIYWRSAKEFGRDGAFGPHRFRYCVASTAPVEDPEMPVAGAAILGITAKVYREHYDRGQREVAARRFVKALEAERRQCEGFAKRIFDRRRQGDLFDSAHKESEEA